MKIKDNKLGPIMKVITCGIGKDRMHIRVEHLLSMGKIPSDDINEEVSKVFINTVRDFIRNNNIDFIPNGNFDSSEQIIKQVPCWEFIVYGREIDPMDYFIKALDENK